MQSSTAQNIPGAPSSWSGGAKRQSAAMTGDTPAAKRPSPPNAAMDVPDEGTRSGAELTRAMLQMQARLAVIEAWIPTNNEVLNDHADKIDKNKLFTTQVGTDMQKQIMTHVEDIAVLRASLVATQTVLDEKDAKLKVSLDDLDTRIREQFVITQQYADKGDEVLARDIKTTRSVIEAVAQTVGQAATPADASAQSAVEALRIQVDQFMKGTVDRVTELDTRMQAHFCGALEEVTALKTNVEKLQATIGDGARVDARNVQQQQ